jgi:hypothetical protein
LGLFFQCNKIEEEEEKETVMKKIAILLVALMFTVPAFAGNIPEFDAVGDDSANFFNDFIKEMVVANNIDASGTNLNQNSAFANEAFGTSASGPDPSPCFPVNAAGALYEDYKAGPWFPNFFTWNIVLQMAPETDLDLNIRDCVLKENQRNIWFYAQQTGRWRQSNGMLRFERSMNPRVTVLASPGPRQAGGAAPFIMDARRMPGLGLVALDQQLYTSKALWEEGIVMKMPEPGTFNQLGQPVFVLREGDVINVRFDIPWNNPVDIYYGPDNVVIKYVGIIGMDYTTLDI